ncbi:hypothetical protein BOX15_Mlig023095g1 [Macrostomum lignano]|uniref:Ubiquitin-like domain-containing protein n=2 Tax=Macrostomum lignano TaxID=282301 RepID=A0A267FST3_9PLAT|nr:hypothetical protein BOX15_Mlig023095g1 [Macrostomum lignano]
MDNLLQIFVKDFNSRTETVSILKDAQIKDLFSKLEEKTGLEPGTYQMVYASKTIDFEQHKDKHLSDFHLENHANLHMVLRLPGGSRLRELDDCIELTEEPDMITWDDDKDNLRVKMPCGHAIGPDSLTMYCRSLLDSGLYRFLCPWLDPNDSRVGCPVEWDFVVIRRLAVLSDEERQEFERKISENYLRRAVNIQECPSCHSYCKRVSSRDRRVVCPACSSGGRQRFEFCWYCLNKWRSAGTDKCGNDICSGKDPRIAILAAAPVKEIVGVKDVPGRRACIHCGMIIEHVRFCKHMKCICGQEFCFICLKPKNSEGNWQCGSFNAPCTIAPRQTQVPGE